jgi:type VI secretion system secreted protein VgrG
MVLINSGGAALPSLPAVIVPPQRPQEAEVADNADPGSKAVTYKHQRAVQSPIKALTLNAPRHNPKSTQNKNKKHWIGLKLVDEAGKPVPGEEYIITLPDGTTVASGTTDEKGEARVENIDPGNCKITFPNLDQDVWDKK